MDSNVFSGESLSGTAETTILLPPLQDKNPLSPKEICEHTAKQYDENGTGQCECGLL